jgi:hypothetical protein
MIVDPLVSREASDPSDAVSKMQQAIYASAVSGFKDVFRGEIIDPTHTVTT